MDIISSLAVVTLAALIHASFQLSVSSLTLLSGHAIGARYSRGSMLRLTTSFVAGSGFITILLLSFIAFIVLHAFGKDIPLLMWAIACGLMLGVGVAIWAFYYRRNKGTSLWVPRGIAMFLTERIKATKSAPEAFSLGLMTVLGELLFIIAPLLVSALVLVELPTQWQLIGIAIYTVISLITLGSVWALIGGGHKVSEIQKWRESNKYFMQFIAGSGLVVLGVFVYVFAILGNSSGGM